ncbi:MAG: SRPBCC domain-containing protein [Bacteroidota bacterium]
MEKMVFQTLISASKEKLWDSLWTDANYQVWTSAFAEGSKAESDWKKGSRILFTDGKGSCMISMIAENRPYDFMSFQHLGELKNGVEDMETAKTQGWAGAYENYTLKDVNGKTELTVEMDNMGMSQDMLDYFNNTWPKALEKLKGIAEE